MDTVSEIQSLLEKLGQFRQWILEKKSEGDDDRAVFLYSEPKGEVENYAQCATCFLWTGPACLIHGKEVQVTGDMTCCYYVQGNPQKEMQGKEFISVTPKESALQKRAVRCENCQYFSKGACGWFKMVNEAFPDLFNLDVSVKEKACCSMNTERQ